MSQISRFPPQVRCSILPHFQTCFSFTDGGNGSSTRPSTRQSPWQSTLVSRRTDVHVRLDLPLHQPTIIRPVHRYQYTTLSLCSMVLFVRSILRFSNSISQECMGMIFSIEINIPPVFDRSFLVLINIRLLEEQIWAPLDSARLRKFCSQSCVSMANK